MPCTLIGLKNISNFIPKKVAKQSFPTVFRTAIVMEFFERGAYYGLMSVLSVYLVMDTAVGGLGFSKIDVGIIKSITTPLLYFLPILSGALGEKFGYKRILFFAFLLLTVGYFFAGISYSYSAIFASLLIMALGAGLFKPIISGTIARVTNESNSSLGFGIYYWSINLGAFLFPLILIPYLKDLGWTYVFMASAIATGLMFFLNIFAYKEPQTKEKPKSLVNTLSDMILVITDLKFIVLVIIYSLFWIMYFQMYDSVLWYVTEYLDMTPVNNFVNSFLSVFVSNPQWKFEAEHVTVVNAGAIILLQLWISALVRKTKALPTMIIGLGFGSLGMLMLALGGGAWMFIAGAVVFTIGEMVAHPKFISYVGLMAPPDKKAMYLGYSFLYGVIGSGIGGILGAFLYQRIIEEQGRPWLFWVIFSAIGVVSIIGLLIYNALLKKTK